MSVRHAVLFKTHFWDDFARRQFERLQARMKSGDLYVFIDESRKPAGPIGHDKVIRATASDFARLGLAMTSTDGTVLWYNIDYPHYLFRQQFPDYDYYLTVEYDGVIGLGIDDWMEAMAQRQLDYVGFPGRESLDTWYWTAVHEKVYPRQEMLSSLSCLAVFSARALDLLFRRRQEMSRDYETRKITFWPNNEVFIPTELRRAKLHLGSLADFGRTDRYEWWPPHHEDELGETKGEFVHPVLDARRYLPSRLKFEPDLASYESEQSALRQALAHYPREVVQRALRRERFRRLVEPIQSRVDHVKRRMGKA